MNIFNFIKSFSNRLRTVAHPDAIRDWIALLTLSILAFMSIVVWNVWAFDTVANGGVIGTTVTSAPPVFNHSSLDLIHTIFAKRAAEEAKYVTGVYRYADPSQ